MNYFLSDDDMVGFGDADEVPSRFNLQLLRYCQPKGDMIDIGIWFPMGRLNNAFQTDWPVPDHPYALGDPTYHTFKSAQTKYESGVTPTRNRGASGNYLLGGMHMTRH